MLHTINSLAPCVSMKCEIDGDLGILEALRILGVQACHCERKSHLQDMLQQTH